MERVIAIVGPTAVGKSQLALKLAQALDGEIVGADSRQVYRHMDIGTAKPTLQERAVVPHHLVDITNPDGDFSLAQYEEMAYRAIREIQERGRVPFLVGGSGLYVRAVLDGWQIPRVPPDAGFRRKLEERAAVGEGEAIYRELVAVAPVVAATIDARNTRRVIRALEVYTQVEPAGSYRRKQPPTFESLIIGLTASREELYRRTDARVDEMIKGGLVEEVRKLVNMGYGFDLPTMSGIGYRQAGMYLRNELTLEEAVQQIKSETHRFVRHQYAWFRLNDPKINWFDVQNEGMESGVRKLVADFLDGQYKSAAEA